MELKERVVDSTKEIFTTMVMMEIEESGDAIEMLTTFHDGISGVIGLAGTFKGVMAIHLPSSVAFAITGNFLGMEVNEINEDVEDAIGEIANMLGGNIKTILSEKGRDIDLSLPSTISGKDYEFQTSKNAERTIVKFSTDNGDFFVELQLEN